MNAFDRKLSSDGEFPLRAQAVATLQANMGYKCNLRCTHCHIEASPERTEEMSSKTVDRIIIILKEHPEIAALDITGGSPELNTHYRQLIEAASGQGKNVLVRSNLAILTEPGMEDIPDLWMKHKVKIVASLPCYTAEGVDLQRGRGTYDRAVSVLKRLNSLGYGQEDTGLEIDIMFNPAKEGIAPDQKILEKAYREKLREMHGIQFNSLTALSNMPIGRLGNSMNENDKQAYLRELEEKYNPRTVKNLMCRNLISVAPDGTIYDCDFWQVLKIPVKNRTSNHVKHFDYSGLSNREIVTARLCFMCTAGAGAGCSGALA